MDARPRGPYVIAAVGGSGSRVLAASSGNLASGIGANLNRPLGALDFADYCARWIRAFAGGASRPPSTTILHQMRQGLNDVASRIRERRECRLGMEELGKRSPTALSSRRVPECEIPASSARSARHGVFAESVSSAPLWKRAADAGGKGAGASRCARLPCGVVSNLMAADYAETHLRDQYLLARFEDLCASPVQAVQRILDFCGLKGDAVRIARDQIVAPSSIRRWQHQPSQTVARLGDVARVALQRFGYGDGHGMTPLRRTPRDRVMAFEQALRSRLSAGLGGMLPNVTDCYVRSAAESSFTAGEDPASSLGR
jgi:hypothetical protein